MLKLQGKFKVIWHIIGFLGLFLSHLTIWASMKGGEGTFFTSKKGALKNKAALRSSLKKHKTPKKSLIFSLESSYEGYVGEQGSSIKKDPFVLGIQIKTPKKAKSASDGKSSLSLNTKVEFDASDSLAPYVNIRDAYYSYFFKKNVQLSMGFKDFVWNAIDHKWSLGLWQPQVRRDFLNPKQNGLLGFFLKLGRRKKVLTLFLSGLFIPDKGPHFQEKEGKILSKNHWFSGPQESIEIEGVKTPIKYTLVRPDVEEVLFQPSIALNYKHIFLKNYYYSFSVAHKPMNQLNLLMNHHLITVDSSAHTSVYIYPKVVKHNIYSLDLGVKSKSNKAWVSYNYDRPIYEDVETSTLEQSSLVEAQFLGAYVSHRFRKQKRSFLKALSIHGGFLMSQQKVLNKNNDSILENVENSLQRFDYDEFINMGFLKRHLKLSYSLDYFYSVKNEGGFLKSKLSYLLNKEWSLQMGLQIIGSRMSNNSFYDKYRLNDSLSLGVAYVF